MKKIGVVVLTLSFLGIGCTTDDLPRKETKKIQPSTDKKIKKTKINGSPRAPKGLVRPEFQK